ncbi:transposase [Rhizobium sp. 9140]|uniref:transposase n=1 Tax=Rhizobium sp. 9140 TaxID=1761900 RepID=UPI0007990A58|nr:transposase [Rhizobium sp. 9140]CZT37444.1 transposase [Rhizobium sp. 9140]
MRKLAALLVEQEPQRAVFEATGPYHRELETALASAGLLYAKANPRKVRRFADVVGIHAKTDRVDAKLLARFAAMVEIAPTTQKSASLQALGELMNARKSLVADRTAIKNRSHVQTAKLLIRQNEARLKLIESQIKAIDQEAMKLIGADAAFTARFKILVSIPGISSLTACVMLTEMPEIGTLDQRQVAFLAGLAPHARESGKWKGKRFICGGRGTLRQALYMPALVASRFNADFKEKYQALIAVRKPPKLALTVIMRKLIILANAFIRDARVWNEKYA